jgi:hypothetical protein
MLELPECVRTGFSGGGGPGRSRSERAGDSTRCGPPLGDVAESRLSIGSDARRSDRLGFSESGGLASGIGSENESSAP